MVNVPVSTLDDTLEIFFGMSHCHIVVFLNTWMYYFCLTSNEHGVNNVRQTEIHAAQLSVPKSSLLRLRLILKSFNDIN